MHIVSPMGCTVNVTSTIETVRDWPLDDQLDLVFRLWDHILDSGWQPTISPELLKELDARTAAYEADPSRGMTWEQALVQIRRKS
jgi:putative addiction module component (TIGR02574 family)